MQPAQQATRVLREFHSGWMECEDAQGVFYYNNITKQSCDDVPPELRAAAPPPQQPQLQQQMQQQMQQPQQAQQQVEVLRELPRDWVQCRDAQGIFYYNKATQRSSDDLPDELRAPEPAPAPAAHYAQPTHGAHLQPQYLQQQPQQPQPQPQQQAQPTVHAKVGDWSVCEDDQGIYYFHHPSGRSTEEQPPEVARYLADGRQRPAASAGAPGQHGAHGGQMPHAPSYAPAQSYAAPKPAVVQYSTLGGAGAHYTASGGYGAAAQPYPQQPGKGKVPHLE
ncbi:unnamed protein product [Prorocentrum cordatum]|uniref:WW domain-containing protein n=1 Tax=Prorocentrum cordatum TaxID=2364126 RepID=A0ABN9PTB5_9DINO|nr:unnamed protein product [Polarella glacialis]